MAQTFTPIDKESLLVTGQVYSQPQKCFFDYHLMNMTIEELKSMTLYKFFSINALIPLLTNSMLYIDRVCSWEDVYENFFLKETFYSKSLKTTIGTDAIANAVFGQCWTYAPETDAMWRIYSPNKTGVRIKTTTGKLFSTIFVDDTCIADTWLGKVEYNSEQAMNDFILKETETDSLSIWRDLMPYSQFLKRTEFEHEREFRIIKMLDSQNTENAKPFKRLAFKINIDEFIDSYLLDPRLDDTSYQQLKQQLIARGADPTKISKSPLYSFTPLTIILD